MQSIPRFLIVSLLPALVLTACLNNEPQTEDEGSAAVPRIALPVQVLEAAPGSIAQHVEVQTRLESSRRQDLIVLASGIVAELPLRNGNVVEAGSLVLKLDPLPEDVDALEEAGRGLQRAERSLQRLQALQQRVEGAVATNDLDRAQDAVDDARLRLQRIERDLEHRRMRAPFSGVIDGMDAVLGQRLNVGQVFARLQEIGSFTIPVQVSESALGRLRQGLRVRVEPLDVEAAMGRILSMPSAIDPQSGSGTVVVQVDEAPASWRPGAFALLRILTDEQPGPVVLPRNCILYQRNRPFVWLLHPDPDHSEDEPAWIVQRAWLELGAGDEDQVIVLKGLEAGSWVVRDGSSGLSEGVPVMPQQGVSVSGPPEQTEPTQEQLPQDPDAEGRRGQGSGQGRGRAR